MHDAADPVESHEHLIALLTLQTVSLTLPNGSTAEHGMVQHSTA